MPGLFTSAVGGHSELASLVILAVGSALSKATYRPPYPPARTLVSLEQQKRGVQLPGSLALVAVLGWVGLRPGALVW